MAGSSSTLRKDKLFKVLVIGDTDVGKSSIILRYASKRFDERYKSSIGVDFSLKTIEWDCNTVVRLQLWDIAGQEWFKKMSRVYYKGAMGALVVFDIRNSSTLEAASKWKQDLDSKVCLESGRPVPAVLVANKCDLTGNDSDVAGSLDGFCIDNSFTCWFKTSAKENVNIDEAFAVLVKQMMRCDVGLSNEEDDGGLVKLNLPREESKSRTPCC
ncbi:ras-related protein Rab-32 [Labrus bergylta]|uniref:ras-related protein Rab-32 n=1 Tax=Labrus bergylta TaxID=56723 RepID=UPI003313D218